MSRKSRSDSSHVMSQQIGQVIIPPSHVNLRDCDIPFWRAIVGARANWNDNDLVQAANLARCYADIERLQKEIDTEGDVIKNDRGTPVMNPRHSLLETLSRRSVALSRIIQVHAQATQGDSGAQVKKNTAGAKAKAAQQQVADDDLIPGVSGLH